MFVLEYIWLDSDHEFRSKTRLSNVISEWNFDGSSTGQATTDESEIILRPVYSCENPFKYIGGYKCMLVLCDTWINDHTPHPTNTRMASLHIFEKYKDHKPLFGLEQEFFLKLPPPELCEHGKSNFYCKHNQSTGRECVEDIFDKCVRAGLGITGMNAEVAPYQWELQVCEYGVKAADQLIMMRYIMDSVAKKYNYDIILHPKPYKHCNGSGCHVNFSTESIRNGDYDIEYIMEKFAEKHQEHLAVYGEKNHLRLTGKNETCDIECFKWGRGDRTVSIRCNMGYFEDRRPASDIDPYIVTSKILDTLFS